MATLLFDDLPHVPPERLAELAAACRKDFATRWAAFGLEGDADGILSTLYLPLAEFLARHRRQRPTPLLVGVNGAQGSGKSTLCALLRTVLEQGYGLRTAILSIDDLYLTRAERLALAAARHPLLATRGVPGTHDVTMGRGLLQEMATLPAGVTLPLPRFDKARDDRAPQQEWPRITGPLDLILFEGWCVAAAPQPPELLTAPVNRLEAEEDGDGRWRRFVNEQLAGPYAELFAGIDLLLMLAVPDFASVFDWRRQQERQLVAALGDQGAALPLLDDNALRRFIAHYERLTRFMLAEMPGRADLVLRLDRQHRIVAAERNQP